MQAVEHADDREDRAVLGPQAVDPGDDLHQAGDAGRQPGATRTLSGARRPPGASIGDGREGAVGRAQAIALRAGRERQPPAGRTGRAPRPRPRRRSARPPGSGRGRCRSGRSSGGQAVRAVGRGGADGVEGTASASRERAGRRPTQRAEVGGAPEPLAEVAGERPDVRAGRAARRRGSRSAGPGRVSSHDTSVERVDRDLALGQLDRLAGAGHGVGAPAADLDRASRPAVAARSGR